MSGLRVLVTRPEPGASATAARLAGLGHHPVILPLTSTVAIQVGETDLGRMAAVIVTSANAIRHAPAEVLARLSGLPWFAVGDATASAAKTAGMTDVASADGDVGDLLELIRRNQPAKLPIAYLCGRVRRPELETGLLLAGRTVQSVETYDTVDTGYDKSALALLLGAAPFDAGLVHSRASASALAGLIEQNPSLGLQNARWIAISARAGEPLVKAGILVEFADGPTEAAILAKL